MAGGIHKSLPAKKREEGEKKYSSRWDVLCITKESLLFFTLIVCLMRSWHHQFPCSVKDKICVCIVWELEDSVFNIVNHLDCQYAKTGKICFTVVSYFDVNITNFSDLCRNNAL